MKIYIFVALVVLVLTVDSQAQECNAKDIATNGVQTLPGVGYWMQAFGDCRLTYTGVGGVGSKLYNLCTKKAEEFPGGIDPFPVPSADDKMRNEMYLRPGLSFYTLKDNSVPLFMDPVNSGVYQSVGMLQSLPSETRVRVAVGWRAGGFVDYSIKRNGDSYKVTPLQTVRAAVCTNVPGGTLDSEIPVLSRNGLFIAARDRSNANTKIFRISDTGGVSRSCEVAAEIPGGRTGKVSFDFDNDHVMYTMTDPVSGKGRLMQLSLKTGIIRTISGPDEDVMYVTSKPNGEILYTRRTMGGYSSNASSELVILKSSAVNNLKNSTAYETLGLLWAKSCNRTLDLDYALAVGQRMNKNVCSRIVTQANYNAMPVGERQVTSFASLKSACGNTSEGDGGSAPVNSTTNVTR